MPGYGGQEITRICDCPWHCWNLFAFILVATTSLKAAPAHANQNLPDLSSQDVESCSVYSLRQLCLCGLQQSLQINALGSLNGKTQCSVPDELCERTEASADTEDGCVVQCLAEAVVVEEYS